MPVMRVDAHFTVMEAALKGFRKWVAAHGKDPQQDVSVDTIELRKAHLLIVQPRNLRERL